MNFTELAHFLKKGHSSGLFSYGDISRVLKITKPTARRIVAGNKPKDPEIVARLPLTRPWHNLSDLSPEQVRYLFDHREDFDQCH